MKKILLISFSDISHDPRVMRQIKILSNSYDVSVAGYGNKPEAVISFFRMEKSSVGKFCKVLSAAKLLLFCYNSYYYRKYLKVNDKLIQKLQGHHFDAVIANDVSALPLAFKLARQAPVILDAHEYSPREFEDSFLWKILYSRYYTYLCTKYFPKISSMMTVCQGIADEYERNFGTKPVVVTNAPAYCNLLPSATQHDVVRMIHHGVAIPSRHLEDMIEMMKYVDERYWLDFMLVPSSKYYFEQLKSLAESNIRIRFVAPVPMNDLSNICNQYDIGIFLLRPVNFNYKHALPNKLFEFIQGRLAVAIGPSPEMARIVEKYDCGVVADSFSPKDLAARLNALTSDQIQYFKNRSHEAATKLCVEANAQTIIDLIEGV